jgi:hypothetical protein
MVIMVKDKNARQLFLTKLNIIFNPYRYRFRSKSKTAYTITLFGDNTNNYYSIFNADRAIAQVDNKEKPVASHGMLQGVQRTPAKLGIERSSKSAERKPPGV